MEGERTLEEEMDVIASDLMIVERGRMDNGVAAVLGVAVGGGDSRSAYFSDSAWSDAIDERRGSV